MKITKILLSTFIGLTLAFVFSACSQNAAVNNAAADSAGAGSNTAAVVNSNQLAANNAATSDSKTSPAPASASVCDTTAFVTDKDPKGLNVRDSSSESGKVIGQVPFNKDGTTVHIISSSSNGWVMIDKATIVTATDEKSVFDKKGWVSANLLAITTRGYDAGGVELYEGAKGSKVLTKIPEDMEMKILGCDGKRMKVEYKNFTGWLEPDAQCDSAVTRCN
jgi:SH3-like domain-containing protein